ncbi:MAG: MFS transporter [Bacillota bacterium]|nr:MFS transporter [Bacillota bacterium]
MELKKINKSKMVDQPRPWLALFILILAAAMDMMDVCIVNVAIPVIQKDIGVKYSMLQWVIAGYALSFAILLITGGRLGDIFGRKKLFLIGIAGFTITSVMCGLAQTGITLVVWRFLQGALAAMMVPQVLSIIQVIFPPEKRGSAAAVYGSMAGLATVLGPVIGALLTQNNILGLSWRPIFFINVPVGITAFIAGSLILKESKAPNAHKLDIPGVIIITIALLMLIYPIIQGNDSGWPLWGYILMVASVPVFISFVLYELRVSRKGSPLIVLSLFKNRAFTIGLIVNFLTYAGVTSFFMLLNIYTQTGLGYSVLNAGLITLPWSVGMGITSAIASQYVYKYGRKMLFLGTLLLLVGIAALIFTINHFGIDIKVWQLSIGLVVGGLGMGFVVPILLTMIVAGVQKNDAGSASGIINTVAQIGNAVGIAIIGIVLLSSLSSTSPKSVNAAIPEMKMEFSKIGISTQVSNSIVGEYSKEYIERMAKSSFSSNESLSATTNAKPIDPAVKKVIDRVTGKAIKYSFSNSTRLSLGFNIIVFFLSFIMLFFFPLNAKVKEQSLI